MSIVLTAVLCLCIFLLRLIGVLTDHELSNKGRLLPLVDMPDADNAYQSISFVDQVGFDFDVDHEEIEVLLQEWDSVRASKLVNQHQHYLKIVEQASKLVGFKSTALSSIDLPNYSDMGALSKLPLIKAKLLTQQGNFLEATKYLLVSLRFNDLIKHDANPTLISYLVGQSYQSRTLSQVAEFVQSNDIPDKALVILQQELAKLSVYANDGFEMVWSGEQIFSSVTLKDAMDTSLFERIDNIGSRSYIEAWFNIPFVLIPEYVMQPGKLNSQSLAYWQQAQIRSQFLCADRPYGHDIDSKTPELSWHQLLAPNGLAQLIYVLPSAGQLDIYFHRRCAGHFQVNATRLLIAIKRFETQNSRLIESLSELIPDYIDALPIDPFSGRPIKHDSSARYLYSYGANFNDDGGSLSSLYTFKCHRDEQCFNNPTVLISADEGLLREQHKTQSTY